MKKKIPYGILELVFEAAVDMSSNRLPYAHTTALDDLKHDLVRAIGKRHDKWRALVLPLLPEGVEIEQLASDAATMRLLGPELFQDLDEKCRTLMAEEAEVSVPDDPLCIDDLPRRLTEGLVYSSESRAVLEMHGVVKPRARAQGGQEPQV